VGANYRNRGEVFALERKHMLLVSEQNDSFCRCFTKQSTMFQQIGPLLWGGRNELLPYSVLEEARFDQQLQQATNAHIERRFLNLAPLDSFEQFLAPPLWRGHLQIEPGIHRGSGALDRHKPVGHHHSIIPPLAAQYLS